MQYTDEQNAIANWSSGNLLVSSLAGTGKTETVSYRIKNLLNLNKTVLCLCFTNAAVGQLSKRLTNRGLGQRVRVSTIDSYASQMLKQFDIKVSDCLYVIRDVFQSFGLSTSNSDLKSFQKLASFNYFQNSQTDVSIPGVSPEMVLQLFAAYDAKKRELGVLDFSDATILATEYVKRNRHLFEFDEIIVDEAQDLNPLQFTFVKELSVGSSLTFVGDQNQSIFAFAGVSADLFKENCGGWDELFLTESFRSAGRIIETVNKSLIKLDSKLLVTARPGGNVMVGEADESDQWLEDHVSGKPAVLGANRFELLTTALRFEEKGYKVWRSWVNSKGDLSGFDIVFSSIHKAKGLEFESVLVKNIPLHGFKGVDGDRLLYVSLSRAKENMFLEKSKDGLPTILDGE